MTTTTLTSARLANPRRTNLASLVHGSDLAGCDQAGCHNVAVLVVQSDAGRRLVCRTHA